MNSNFRVPPEGMIKRSGTLTESVQVSEIIISLVSFKKTTIFSRLSSKQPPVSLSCTYNHVVALTRHLGGQENKPTEVQKGVQNTTAAKLQPVFHHLQI